MATAVETSLGGQERAQTGTFCSTSGTYFTDKDALTAHYKSDFHRYNLKRKVAGLPPVTQEWFEARREQLAAGKSITEGGAAVPVGATRVWVDALTKKKFKTEKTYIAHTRSKKYVDLLREAGLDAVPQPTILVVQRQEMQRPASVYGGESVRTNATDSQIPGKTSAPGYKTHMPSGPPKPAQDDGRSMVDDQSNWETASEDSDIVEVPDAVVDEPAAAMQEGEAEDKVEEEVPEWDLLRSLFDNHPSKSFEANLEYMFKTFGFYLPDAQYLTDPEGLVKYLGAKLQLGRVPLYTAGADASSKRFGTIHAVQRHMVDAQKCKMLYDSNEEEYEEFYDYSPASAAEGDVDMEGKQVATSDASAITQGNMAGYEMVVGEGGSKVLGSRELARFYKQGHRPDDQRRSVVINTMLAKYRNLGIATTAPGDSDAKRAATMAGRRHERNNLRVFMNANIIRDLPKNCPY